MTPTPRERPASLLVVQLGGSTAVANAILAGAVSCAQRCELPVHGAIEGLHGLARGRLVALGGLTERELARLANRSGCALVSHRGILDETMHAALVERLRADGAALLTIGGDGSLRATAQIGREADTAVAGVLNTIDNDVEGFAYSPGFLSAAHQLTETVAASRLDLHAMQSCNDVAVIETMGRDCGWLAAGAGALARADLIVVPERPQALEEVLELVAARVRSDRIATVVVAEGAREPDGELLARRGGEIPDDPLGRPVIDMGVGPASVLANELLARHGLYARVVKPGIAQRGGVPLAIERRAAEALGRAAANALFDGRSGEAFGPGGAIALSSLRTRSLRAPVITSSGVAVEAVRAELEQWLPERDHWTGREQFMYH